MDYTIIDAHSHLWLNQDTIVNGLPVRTIDRGRKNQQILVQPQYHPWPVENEVAVIYCGVNGLLTDVPVEKVKDFEQQLIQSLKLKYNDDVLGVLRTGKLTPDVEQKLTACAKEVVGRIVSSTNE